VRYEHLVQINDPARPDIRHLNRAQLWQGLMLRAARPELFDLTIDTTRVLEETESHQVREVCRGSSTATERVQLFPPEAIELTADPDTVFAGSVLTLRIEEPVAGALFVRFIYSLRGSGVPEDAAEQQALRQAYYFSDIDTIRHIRAMVEDADDKPDGEAAGSPAI
jgi:acetylaranotin biosynthesis cluster protein L